GAAEGRKPLAEGRTMTRRRRWLAVFLVCVLAGWSAVGAEEKTAADRLDREAAAERLRRDITFLASDECEGRGVTTEGINKAAAYIAEEFQKAGLKPVAGQADYFQPFEMAGEAKLGKPNVLVLHGPQGQSIELSFNEHFTVAGISGTGKVDAPVVFAGYGTTAEKLGYDDFQGLDVAGKVVVILRKTPRPDNSPEPFDDRMNGYHA